MRSLLRLLVPVVATLVAHADQNIFQDGAGTLSGGWENWSWSSDINFAATDLAEGTSSILVNSTSYGAFSVKDEVIFGTSYAGLQFDIAADPTQLQIYIQSTTDNSQSLTIPLTAFNPNITPTAFTTVLVNFNDLPPSGAALGPGTWDRINWQVLGNGAVVSPKRSLLARCN